MLARRVRERLAHHLRTPLRHDAGRRDFRPAARDPVRTTFLFANIAGFTALTEAHGDEHAASHVADFCDAVDTELPAVNGTRVKTIGDTVLLVDDPAMVIVLAVRITHELMREHGAPAVRVGLHHGDAVEREGDYFGATERRAQAGGPAATSACA
jgi:adenylate cyclase